MFPCAKLPRRLKRRQRFSRSWNGSGFLSWRLLYTTLLDDFDYLDKDRQIGAAWQNSRGGEFLFADRARKMLGVSL